MVYGNKGMSLIKGTTLIVIFDDMLSMIITKTPTMQVRNDIFC